MKPNFSAETKMNVLVENGFICQYCEERRIVDFHHRLPNTKYNQKKFPKFLQSKANCAGLCRECHISGKVKKFYKITEKEAQERENNAHIRI